MSLDIQLIIDPPDHSEVNDATMNLIKQYEGFVPSPGPDPVGLPTVGYGHKCQQPNCAEVPYPIPLSRDSAHALLRDDLSRFTKCVSNSVSDSVSLNDNQFGTLTSFAYNVGCGAFKSSTLLHRISAGEDPNVVAHDELKKWNKAGGRELKGLTDRRAAEDKLFQKSPS
jgi:lysozyme